VAIAAEKKFCVFRPEAIGCGRFGMTLQAA
jgi:hypothetical protein